MDKKTLAALWERYGGSVFLIVLGAVFLLFPGSAVALTTFGLALVCLAIGGVSAVRMVFYNHRELKDWFYTIGGLAVGIFILLDPMSLADSLGRFLGLFLLIQGGNLRRRTSENGKLLGGLTMAAGIVVFLIPRALIHTLLGLLGAVLALVGIIQLLAARRAGKLQEPRDPNIIDAAE